MISQKYRELNQRLHDQADYGTGGADLTPELVGLIEAQSISTVLDYGAGKQRLTNALRALTSVRVDAYDPAIPQIEHIPLASYDLLVCKDVLEHVEPEWLSAVLDHQAALTRLFCLNIVCRVPAKKNLPDGRNAHLIVKPHDWWAEKFPLYFEILRDDEQSTNSVFVMRRRATPGRR